MTRLFTVLALLATSGCTQMGGMDDAGKQSADSRLNVRVSWTKSNFHDVVGYRVYHGSKPDFDVASAPFVDADANATSLVVSKVPRGMHYFQVFTRGSLTRPDGTPAKSEPVFVELDVQP